MLSVVKGLRKMHALPDRLYWICAQNTSSFLIDVQQSFSPLTTVVFTLFYRVLRVLAKSHETITETIKMKKYLVQYSYQTVYITFKWF